MYLLKKSKDMVNSVDGNFFYWEVSKLKTFSK